MDAFSDVLRVIRLIGGIFLEAELTAPWCLAGRLSAEECQPYVATPRHVIATHFVAAGRMALRVEGAEDIEVSAGELVMMPHNDIHRFGSALDIPLTSASKLLPEPGTGFPLVKHGGGGEATQLFCGFLGSEIAFDPLFQSLPPVLKMNLRTTASGVWIESSFRFAASEIAAGRLGSTTVITKLSEMLFVEATSQFVASLPPERRGWLAGLKDPQIGRALSLLHARPMHAWTAEGLASEVNMSRSALAERFATLVGETPMHYLAQWRMHLAAQQLREGRGSVAQVAFDVGYDSEAAFSRAFKRQFGASPGAWRRN